jgi:hypothetical protein
MNGSLNGSFGKKLLCLTESADHAIRAKAAGIPKAW